MTKLSGSGMDCPKTRKPCQRGCGAWDYGCCQKDAAWAAAREQVEPYALAAWRVLNHDNDFAGDTPATVSDRKALIDALAKVFIRNRAKDSPK